MGFSLPTCTQRETMLDASMEDAELLRCMSAGCTDCFSVFFRRYCKLAFAIAFRILRKTADAEEVVQEVFLSIFQQNNPYDPERSSIKTWLANFAYFKALQLRRRLSIKECTPLEEWVAFERDAQLKPLRSIEDRAILVEECLRTLNSQQRRTIELVYIEGYTLIETSKILNETLANTRNHCYRGLKSLRLRLCAIPMVGVSAAIPRVRQHSEEIDAGMLLEAHF